MHLIGSPAGCLSSICCDLEAARRRDKYAFTEF